MRYSVFAHFLGGSLTPLTGDMVTMAQMVADTSQIRARQIRTMEEGGEGNYFQKDDE